MSADPQAVTSPSPATTDWVPLWNLSGVPSADITYNGDYPTASPYTDGDIVVYGNVAYLCVAPTSAAPVAWPGTAYATPPTPVTAYGTTLSASPADGQEAILVDSVTNPTYTWRFRYNASSTSPYKWEFIGGPPAAPAIGGNLTTSSQSFVDFTGAPTFTLPRAGDYVFTWSLSAQPQGSGNLQVTGRVLVGATGSQPIIVVTTAAYMTLGIGTTEKITGTAGALAKIQVSLNAVTSTIFLTGSLAVTPVRVS